MRKEFFEATPKQVGKSLLGAKGLAYWWDTLSTDERLQKRQEKLQPLMEDFFAWCRRQSVLPGSKLGKAIEYSLKYEETFKTILKDGHLVLSNHLAERTIKSLFMRPSKRVQWTLLAWAQFKKARVVVFSKFWRS